jgi:hypothetical protein
VFLEEGAEELVVEERSFLHGRCVELPERRCARDVREEDCHLAIGRGNSSSRCVLAAAARRVACPNDDDDELGGAVCRASRIEHVLDESEVCMELLKWGAELHEPFDKCVAPNLPAIEPIHTQVRNTRNMEQPRAHPMHARTRTTTRTHVLEEEDLEDVKADSPDMVLSRVITSCTVWELA